MRQVIESSIAGSETSSRMTPMTAAEKSIVFVVNCLGLGGAEVQVTRLAQGLKRRGWRVAVVSMIPFLPLRLVLRKAKIRTYTLNMKPGIANPLAILKLRRILNRLRPTVVHSHILHANLLARVTRLTADMPVLLCTAHNIREGGWIYEQGYRLTDRLADLTTNVSQAAVDRYVRIGAAPKDRIRFVANGVDTRRFSPDPAARQQLRAGLGLGDRFVWLAIGRLEKQKDYPNVLRAFASVRASALAANSVASARDPLLMIAGEGKLQQETENLARTMGIAEHVRFLGARSDVPALMNAADALVLGSAWEGMPLVLQEAGACGLPMAVTDVGGNAEVVLDGRCGFLAPAHDSPALAAAMNRLAALDPAELSRMGRFAREHVVENYSMDAVLDTWEQTYANLLGRTHLLTMEGAI